MERKRTRLFEASRLVLGIDKLFTMNIQELHHKEKIMSAHLFFKGETATSIQLLKGGMLKEHITVIPALLLCITGSVIYNDENGKETELKPGDYMRIQPQIKHWLNAFEDAQLLLLK